MLDPFYRGAYPFITRSGLKPCQALGCHPAPQTTAPRRAVQQGRAFSQSSRMPYEKEVRALLGENAFNATLEAVDQGQINLAQIKNIALKLNVKTYGSLQQSMESEASLATGSPSKMCSSTVTRTTPRMSPWTGWLWFSGTRTSASSRLPYRLWACQGRSSIAILCNNIL